MQMYLLPPAIVLFVLGAAGAAFLSQRSFSGRTSSKGLKFAVAGCWIGLAACCAVFAWIEHQLYVWRPAGSFQSPDRRFIAQVEMEHHSFFDSYEVSFRVRIVGAGGLLVLNEEFTDLEVVPNVWDRPSAEFRWNGDSRSGELVTTNAKEDLQLP